MFKDKQNILLVNPKDSLAIKQALVFLVKNKDFAANLGKNGKILAKNYDWNKISQKINRVYNLI